MVAQRCPSKTKTRTKTKMKTKTIIKTKKKAKTKMKIKRKTKTKPKKNENENGFSFLLSICFSFSFSFLFLLSKSFCIFVNSTCPRRAIDGQLSLDWLRSGIAFLLTSGDLETYSLLLGLEMPQNFYLPIFLMA